MIVYYVLGEVFVGGSMVENGIERGGSRYGK